MTDKQSAHVPNKPTAPGGSGSREVVVYTTDYCPYCTAAKDLLRSKGVSFVERDVTGDDATRTKLVEMTGGRTTVPQIFVDGRAMGGYDDLARFFRNGGKI